MQKSQEGLLRSLLYQVPKECPALIGTVLPSWWETEHSGTPLWSVQRENEDPEYALKAKVKVLFDIDIIFTYEELQRHLNACGKDMLEVSIDLLEDTLIFRYTVIFLHRSIRDFLMLKEVHEMLRSPISSDFDPRRSLAGISCDDKDAS